VAKRLIKNKPAKPFNLILLGDPAAGKATQAAMLVKKFGLYDFDMGNEQVLLRQKNKKVDREMKTTTDKGHLTPTWICRFIQQEMFTKVPAAQGILYDGTPRMLGEAKLATRLLKQHHRRDPLVIYLSIPFAEILKRISLRKGYFGGKYGKRVDDTAEAVKNRARYYRTNVAQVIKYFKSEYKFKKVSGLGSPAQVQKRILKIVKQFINKL
jgi:adenylate kinase